MANSTRNSRVVSISLPRPAGEELDRLAREWELSRSALLREALREYRLTRERMELDRLFRLGSRHGRRAGIRTEAQVVTMLHGRGARSMTKRRARRPRR